MLLAPSVSSDDDVRGVVARRDRGAARPRRCRSRSGSARRSGRSARWRRSRPGCRCRSPSGGRSSGSGARRAALAWSLVGAWTTSAKLLKATIPIWVVDACCLMNAAAAASAACRAGSASMSVEHMLPETSIVRMIVVWLVGHGHDRDRPAEGHDEGAERDEEQGERAGGAAAREVPGCGRRESGSGSSSGRRRAPAPAQAPDVDRPIRSRHGSPASDQQRPSPQEAPSGAAPRPAHGSAQPDSEVSRRRPAAGCPPRRTSAVSSIGCGLDDEPGVEVVVDRRQAARVGGAVVRAAGHLGDLLERRLVELRCGP